MPDSTGTRPMPRHNRRATASPSASQTHSAAFHPQAHQVTKISIKAEFEKPPALPTF